MENRLYELTDEQWERVKDMIQHFKMGKPPKDDRLILHAMFLLVRSSVQWKYFLNRCGSWKVVYSRFYKWRNNGTLLWIFLSLNKDVDMGNLSLHSIAQSSRHTPIVLVLKREYK